MSLGIDYLTRSGVIKEFFDVPSTIFVESIDKKSKKIISIKESLDHADCYTSRIYDLSATEASNELPASKEYLVPKNEVFVHEKVILSAHMPIPYCDTSVDHRRNVYNSPMEEEDYRYFLENYLLSSRHRAWRADWLWRAYMMLYLPSLVDKMWDSRRYWQKRLIVEREQSLVRGTKPKSFWIRWALWRNELIKDESSPNELVFKWAYNEQRQRFTSASFSFSQQI